MQEVYEFLKKCGTYYLATTEGNQPRVRPFGTYLIFENKLYIQTGKSKNVSKQMKANADSEAIRQLKETVAESYIVGDSNTSQGTLWNAVTSAFDAAMAI